MFVGLNLAPRLTGESLSVKRIAFVVGIFANMYWRLILAVALFLWPSFVKVFVFRHIGRYRIGKGVRIGFSIFAPHAADIADRVRIGHGNVLAFTRKVELGADSKIGHFNLILGGEQLHLGEGAWIVRFNEINAILQPLANGEFDSRLLIGSRTVITAWHKIDFTDRVTFGENVVFAGRQSCIWTHNRQQVRPVSIGRNCYVGSGIQMAPGSSIGAFCVVGMGSIITRPVTEEYHLVAGMPARAIRPLDEDGKVFVTFPTRPDLDEITTFAQAR